MTTSTQSDTKKFSRKTIQLMLQLKALLNDQGVMINLSNSNAYEQMIKASSQVNDIEIKAVRMRLISATSCDADILSEGQIKVSYMVPRLSTVVQP